MVVVVTEVTEGLRHNMEVQDDHIVEEVDKLREHYRQVHSSICLYIPSVTYLDLDFSLQVADFPTGMEGSYSLSWTCIHLGSSPQVVDFPTGMEGSYSLSLSCKL